MQNAEWRKRMKGQKKQSKCTDTIKFSRHTDKLVKKSNEKILCGICVCERKKERGRKGKVNITAPRRVFDEIG